MASEQEAKGTGLVGRTLVALAGWSALLAPAVIVRHESGHIIAELTLGYQVRLNAASVSDGPALGEAADWAVAMQAGPGPLVTNTLMVIAALGQGRRVLPPWAFALAIIAPLRFLVGGTYLFWVARAWMAETDFQGTPDFDEYNAAVALGISRVVLVAIQMAAVIGYWIWALARAGPGRGSWASGAYSSVP